MLHMIGNAHLDPVWLWRWPEGCAEAIATGWSAVDRLDEHAGFRHLVFMGAENFAKIFDFLIHALKHLAHGVNFYFAFFVTFESKTDG